MQRVGFLYGTYKRDEGAEYGVKAVVEAVYEPPQRCTATDFVLPADPMEGTVERIAGEQQAGVCLATHGLTRLPHLWWQGCVPAPPPNLILSPPPHPHLPPPRRRLHPPQRCHARSCCQLGVA